MMAHGLKPEEVIDDVNSSEKVTCDDSGEAFWTRAAWLVFVAANV